MKKFLLIVGILLLSLPLYAQVNYLYVNDLPVGEKPWIDVTHPTYNAAGDGETDDTTPIDSAIDAASANATVFLPDGTYIFSNQTYNKSVRIVGQSKEGTVIKWKANSAESNLFYFGTSQINVTFENLTIDGNYSNQTDSTGSYASITFVGAAGSHLTLKNVKFVNGRIADVIAVGTSTADPIYVDIQDCEFVDGLVGTATRSAHHLTISETVDLKFINNRLRASSKPSSYGRAGLVVQRQTGSTDTYFGKVTITNNECLNIGRGTADTLGCLDVYSGAEQVIIANNRAYTPIGRFITAKSDSGNIQIIGNNATGYDGFAASLPAIVLYGSPTVPATKAKNAIIANNILKDPVRTDDYGIFVDGRSSAGVQLFENVLISNNIIEGQWQAGIYGRYIGNTVVKNNVIVDTGVGIFFNNVTGPFEASDNYIEGTTENGISNNAAMTACDGIYKNNTLVNITSRAINLSAHNSYQIEGNTVDGAAYAFYTAGSTERSTVKGNTIRSANEVWQKGGTDANIEIQLTVKDFGATGDGTTDDYAAITAAEAFTDDSGGTLFFPTGTYFIDGGNITFSSNVYIQMAPGATFTRNTTETLTIRSPEHIIVSPRQQITNADMIDFQIGGRVYPEWWGGEGNNSTDNLNAITYAINSFPDTYGGNVHFGDGYYRVSNTVDIQKYGIVLSGEGRGISHIRGTTDNDVIHFAKPTASDDSTLSSCGISDLTVDSADTDNTSVAVVLSRVSASVLTNFGTSYHQRGLRLEGSQNNHFDNISLSAYGNVAASQAGKGMIEIVEYQDHLSAYHNPYINEFTNFKIGGNYLSESAIRLESGDAITFTGGYIQGAKTYAVYANETANTAIASIGFDNVYFDGDGLDTDYAFYVPDSAVAEQISVLRFNNCFFGQFDNGFLLGTEVYSLIVNSCEFANIPGDALSITDASGGSFLSISDNIFRNVATGSSKKAVYFNGAGTLNFKDNTITGATGSGSVGLSLAGTIDALNMGGNILTNNTTNVSNAATITSKIIRDNIGYITENNGTATIADDSTSIAVNHGLAVTPDIQDISVTPTSSLGDATEFYIDTPTSTQFTIHVDADPNGSVTFAWTASVQ